MRLVTPPDMFTDVANKTHNFKILFVGPAQAGKERAVEQLARVLSGDPARDAAGAWTFGVSSYMGAAGGRIALADLQVRVNSASEQTVERLRASSLGLEVVNCGPGADGYDVALHLYWLPVELVPGMLHAGKMAAEWLRGADGVVYVADGRVERDIENATGLADLRTWLTIHQPSTRITALQVIHRSDAMQPIALAIEDVPTFPTVAETGDGIVALARHLLAFAARAPRSAAAPMSAPRRRRAKTTRRNRLAA
ncbi:MAG TPA: hypothetical protein VIV11_34040 [Kofleriaceae bacterium]